MARPAALDLSLTSVFNLGREDAERLVWYINHDRLLNQRQPMNSSEGTLTAEDYLKGTADWCRGKNARLFAIMLEDLPIGTISLVLLSDGQARTGYWLASNYWGRGFGRQAFDLVLAEAALSGVTQIAADIANDNLPSLKLWRRHGARERPSSREGMTAVVLGLF